MSSYIKSPELKKQANELYSQILAGLKEAGVPASMNEHLDGIMIPEYPYVVAEVGEITRGSGFSIHGSGKLEVSFRSLYLGHECLCHAKRFKADTKDLIKKVVSSIKERRDAVIVQTAREEAKTKARESHGSTIKAMRENYPEFSRNIERHNSQINLSFNNLTEDQARLILMTLRNAGIKGDSEDVPSED